MHPLKIRQLRVLRRVHGDRRCPELRDFVTKPGEGILGRLTQRDGARPDGTGPPEKRYQQ